jgi:hypothetical protein
MAIRNTIGYPKGRLQPARPLLGMPTFFPFWGPGEGCEVWPEFFERPELISGAGKELFSCRDQEDGLKLLRNFCLAGDEDCPSLTGGVGQAMLSPSGGAGRPVSCS